MSTDREVGNLYGYFLEAAGRFVHHHIHKRMEIRDPGKGMYEDLVQNLAVGCHMRYINIIMEHEQFLDTQTNRLSYSRSCYR